MKVNKILQTQKVNPTFDININFFYIYLINSLIYLSFSKPLKQAETEITMDSWGMYSVTVTAVVHDDDVTSPWEEFVCTLTLPPANFTSNRTTVYYPGKNLLSTMTISSWISKGSLSL